MNADLNPESGQYKACLRKKAYESDIKAAAAAGLQEFYDKVSLRIYRCPWCNKWHLTSKERKRHDPIPMSSV